MMKIPMLLFCVLLCSVTGYAQSPQYILRKQIEQLLREEGLSGAVWTIVNDSGLIITDAIGYRHQPTQSRLLSNHKMHVGSISKTVLSVGLLRMVTLGLLHLDDPLRNYLPDLPIVNPWEATHPITIRHLLDHRSGLTDAKLWQVFSTTADIHTPLELVYERSPDMLTVQVQPGTIYSYSNLGYTILGLVIEKITHQRYEAYLDQLVLQPLGMTQSTFEFVSQQKDSLLAHGHFDHGVPVTAMPMYLRPAGQFTTTAEDMGKFLQFLMSDGTLHGKEFVRPDLLRSIGVQRATIAYQKGIPHGDALGGYSRDRYGVVGIAKNGNILGFSAMIYFFPSSHKAFFIAFNTDSETANYDKFNELLVRYLGMQSKPYQSFAKALDERLFDWGGYYIPVITKVIPFELLDILFSHVKVNMEQTGARLIPFNGTEKQLLYQGSQLFSQKDRTTVSHAFYTSPDGKRVITDGIKTIQKVSLPYLLGLSISCILGLVGWIYLIVMGFRSFIKKRYLIHQNPYIGILAPFLLLCLSFVMMALQPFMQLGDITFTSVLLFISSLLWLPGLLYFIVIQVCFKKMSLYALPMLASFLCLLWLLLLTIYGMIPLILWH